jgi:hypothetical protein
MGGLSPSNVYLPLLGVHFGATVLDNMELRASFGTLLFVGALQADILYTQPLSDTLRGYGGVGGDVVGYIDLQRFSETMR